MTSKYLLAIAVIVLSYNLTINLTEVLWKSQMKLLYPDPSDYTAYMSNVTFFIGISATLTSCLLSGNIIRNFGWRFAALISPILIITTSVAVSFFLFANQGYSNVETISALFWGMSPLALTVFFGSLQNCCSRTAKYTVFDDTKEMAFIPLSLDERLKGKLAIDGVGSRLGKSGSSLLLQILFLSFGSALSCAPYIFLIIAVVVTIWIRSILFLNNEFNAKTLGKALGDKQKRKLTTVAIASE